MHYGYYMLFQLKFEMGEENHEGGTLKRKKGELVEIVLVR